MAPRRRKQVNAVSTGLERISLDDKEDSSVLVDKLLDFVKNASCSQSMQKEKRKHKRHHTGLENLSNTCYASAVIQSLFYAPGFSEVNAFLRELVQGEQDKKDLYIMYQTALFFFQMEQTSSRKGYIRPDRVLMALKGFFNGEKDSEKPRIEINQSAGYRSDSDSSENDNARVEIIGPQQDSQEFLIYFLSQLHEEQARIMQRKAMLSSASSTSTDNDRWEESTGSSRKAKSIKIQNVGLESDHIQTSISHMFQGKFRNTFKSTSGKSITSNPFFTIPVEIEDEDIESVEDCLDKFFQSEVIYDGDAKVGKTYSEIEKLPIILILHLKRFAFSRQTGESYKVRKTLNIDEDIEIDARYLSGNCKLSLNTSRNGKSLNYKLFSVICHEGMFLNSGHYVNYSYDIISKKWLYCNDETVEIVDNVEQEVLNNKNAYILFYSMVTS